MLLRNSSPLVLACSLVALACGADSDSEGGGVSGTGTTQTGGGDGDGDGDGDRQTGSVSGVDPEETADSTADETATETGESTTDGTGTGGETAATGGSDSATTGVQVPFDCDDGQAPVRVVGGGSYDTIGEGVEAAPPDGVVEVCPGEYSDNVVVERSVTIQGAGSALVTVDGGKGVIFSSSTDATFLRFEGMTLENGTGGISVFWPAAVSQDDPELEIEDVRVTGIQGTGLDVMGLGSYGTVEVASLTIDSCDAGVSAEGGAARLERVTVSFSDSVFEDNAGGEGVMYLAGADVTFTGGRVVSNTAAEGGGAFLVTHSFPGGLPRPATLAVVDSDWGTGAADENQDTDVWCDNVNDAAGFLGNPTDVVCTSDVAPCCL